MQKSMTREKKVAEETHCFLQPRQRTITTMPFSALQKNCPKQQQLEGQISALKPSHDMAHTPTALGIPPARFQKGFIYLWETTIFRP